MTLYVVQSEDAMILGVYDSPSDAREALRKVTGPALVAMVELGAAPDVARWRSEAGEEKA